MLEFKINKYLELTQKVSKPSNSLHQQYGLD